MNEAVLTELELLRGIFVEEGSLLIRGEGEKEEENLPTEVLSSSFPSLLPSNLFGPFLIPFFVLRHALSPSVQPVLTSPPLPLPASLPPSFPLPRPPWALFSDILYFP